MLYRITKLEKNIRDTVGNNEGVFLYFSMKKKSSLRSSRLFLFKVFISFF